MKKLVICFAILAMALFAGCPNETPNNNDPAIGALKSVKNTGIRSLFTSSVSVGGGASKNTRALAAADIKTLSYINAAGQNAPVVFLTSNDKEVLLQVSDMRQVGNKRIVADFSAVYEVEETAENSMVYKKSESRKGKTLIDMETGALYDFTGYTNEFLADGDTLYAVKGGQGGTLYKIDLANIGAAIPLNNPQFNSAGNIQFRIKDKIICGFYSYDVNAAFVPKEVLPIVLTDEECVLAPPNHWIEISVHFLDRTFIDSNNDVWFYFIGGFEGMWDYDRERHYIIGKLSIDDEGQLGISEYSENALSFSPHSSYLYPPVLSADGNSRYYIASEGIAVVKKNPSGAGIIVESINKATPVILQNAFVRGEFMYWTDETSIKRMELTFDKPEEVLYSNSNILGPFFHSGDQIMFYQYLDATTVETYSLSLGNLSEPPKLVTASRAEIDNIVELQF